MLNNLVFISTQARDSLNSQNSLSNAQNVSNTNVSTQSACKSRSLKETPTYIWCKILEFIKRVIPNLDYKSCRDIFKMLLEVAKKVPHSSGDVPPSLENEVTFNKNTFKHKIDMFAHDPMISRYTDDIKLESLYEVAEICFK
jgi:hypothetical protein